MVSGKRLKNITGFEGYTVCESGRVYSLLQQLLQPEKTGELSQRVDRGGYYSCRLSKDGELHTKFVHRLLAEAFIDNPLGLPEVDHFDGNKQNLALENLRWCTHSQNAQFAYDKGINQAAKKIFDSETGQVFTSIRQAASAINMNYNTCCKRLEKKSSDFRLRYLR